MKMYILTVVLALSFCFCKNDHSAVKESIHTKATEEYIQESDKHPMPSTSDSDEYQAESEVNIEKPVTAQKSVNNQSKVESVEEVRLVDSMPAREESAEYGDKLEQVDAGASVAESEEAGPEELYDALLRKYVSTDGRVDYRAMKSKVSDLDQYLDWLEEQKPSAMTRDEALAYWINAYNAFTIKFILDKYPVSSITELDGGNPWDVKRIKLDGRTLSLNQIENEIIRPQFNEARIHFAVNCAARSCPPLMNKAWTAQSLEEDLERQTRQFINNSKFNVISSGSVKISKIFEWYASDFDGLISYLNRYTNRRVNDDARVEYLDYDWALNSL